MTVCVHVHGCVKMCMGGINDQCVTGIHLLGSSGFPKWAEILIEMIYVYVHTSTHTHRCLARGKFSLGFEKVSWHKRMPPSLLSWLAHGLCCVQNVYIFSKKAS